MELARVQAGRVGSGWFRVLAAVMLVVEVVATVLNIIDGGRWPQTILTVAGALLFGAFLIQPRHLRRRIAALSVD